MEKHEQQGFAAQSIPTTIKKRILVVDDSADFLDLNREILEMDDYDVITASSGADALYVLAEMAPPDLILLDMRMEDMSGPEFLIEFEKKQTELFENVPVVFLTAMDKIPASKAVGFIRKPFDIENFLAAIHDFIGIGTGRPRYKH